MTFKYLALCSVGLTVCMAQQYEIGGTAGAGFANGATVTAPAGTATAGFKPGALFGGFLGHRMYERLSGEVRYTYLMHDLRLSAGGQEPTFGAQAHALHYDVLVHTRESESPVQPFVAGGFGMMVYRGTGRETAYQPLGEFAYLTRTRDVKPLASVGAGVRVRLGPRLWLRAEFRDYITPFPEKVIAPARGASISGWVHNIAPMASVSYTF